jgi:hypothetical protein
MTYRSCTENKFQCALNNQFVTFFYADEFETCSGLETGKKIKVQYGCGSESKWSGTADGLGPLFELEVLRQ